MLFDENKNETKKEDNKEISWNKEKPNPNKINLTFNLDIKFKGIILNLYSSISNNKNNNINLNNNEYISIKITNPELKLLLNQEKCEFNLNIKAISLSPNKLKAGEKIIISNNYIKKQEVNIINSESNERQRNKDNSQILNNYSNYLTENNIDSNIGITGFLKKYNPNYLKQLKVIDKAMEKISTQQSHNSSRIEINNINNEEETIKSVYNYNTNREGNYTKFSKTIIETYEATPSLQKMELNRQKNEFHISQVINHYNNIKSKNKINNNNLNNNNKDSNIKNIPKPNTSRNQNNKIISTGKILPLNLFEIHANNSDDSDNNI